MILSTSGGLGGRLGARLFRRHFDPDAFRRALPEAIAYRLADPNVTSLERAHVERLRGRYR